MSAILPPDQTRSPGQSPMRVPFDFYTTPPEATRALLSVEAFDASIWEPACGNGAISRVLAETGHAVVSTDLIDRGYGTPGVDFLREKEPRASHIITNPPYGGGMADKFIGKALTFTRRTGGKVAMLLDLAGLCHPTRHSRYVATPPAAIYGLDELVNWPNGKPPSPSLRAHAHVRFCWLVWKPGHAGRPTFWWLSTRAHRDRSSNYFPNHVSFSDILSVNGRKE